MFDGMNYVYEVYKTRSFSKAAENLYISQPSLSAMVKKIEGKVGAPLFDRSTVPIRLTEFGEQYIRIAEKIMDLEEEFAYFTDNMEELKTGHLSVGGTSFFTSYILPDYVSHFSTLYPHVKVNIFESQSKLLEQKVSDGELDLVIDNYHIDENKFERKILMEEHLLLAVPMSFKVNQNATDYRLTSADIRNHVHLQPDFPGVPLKLFAEEPYITLRSPNDTRKRLEVIFQNIGVRPNIILKLDQLLTAYHLTEHGMGATLVSDTIIKSLPYDSDIAYYKLDDPNAVRNVYLYYRRSKYLTRSMAEFINLAVMPN